MNPDSALKRMMARSSIILQEAEYLKEKEAWNMVVRRSQESVELALKCALLWGRIEVPRIHDVGPILKQYAGAILSLSGAESPISLPSPAC